MARYTREMTVAVPLSDLYQQVTDILKSCSLEILYFKEDYLMAREAPGNVPYAQLVTVEVLIDSTRSTKEESNFNVVVKNEELPLQVNNHCFQLYQQVNEALSANEGWRLINSSTADPVG